MARSAPHRKAQPRPMVAHPRRVAAVVATAVVTMAAGCTRPDAPATGALPDGGSGLVATVERVVDGDTVRLRMAGSGTESARLLGIDTPESVKPDSPVECYGPEASKHTADLLPPGTQVLIQRDREARDRYGRLLVYLWRRDDGLFVNQALLTDGYASVLSISPNTARRAELEAAERTARKARAGLWGACDAAGGR